MREYERKKGNTKEALYYFQKALDCHVVEISPWTYYNLAKYYFDLWNKLRDDFVNKYEMDLIKYFKKYQDLGCIEITTSGVTHGFSPLLATDSNLNAQFKVGQDTTKRLFGKKAMGAWLPECAYRQGYEYVGILENAPSNKCRFRDLDEVTKNRIIQYRKFNKEWNVGKRPVIWAWCIALCVLILFSLLLPFLWIVLLPLLIVYLVMCFGPWRGICFDEDDAWYELNYERLKREKII